MASGAKQEVESSVWLRLQSSTSERKGRRNRPQGSWTASHTQVAVPRLNRLLGRMREPGRV